MHLSVEKVFAFCGAHQIALRIIVFVDGIMVNYCFEACEECGYALCREADAAGKILLRAGESDIRTIGYSGHVRLSMAEDSSEDAIHAFTVLRRVQQQAGAPCHLPPAR